MSNSAVQELMEYEVQSGDSLWKIASRMLGNGNRYMEIYEANRHQMSQPSALAIGMKLVIPGERRVARESTTADTTTADTATENQSASETQAEAQVEAAPENLVEMRSNSTQVMEIKLAPGEWYTVASDDLASSESENWTKLARDRGMSPEWLVLFNQHVETVTNHYGGESEEAVTPTLAAGVKIYIPSAEEIVMAQCRKKEGDLDKATKLFGELRAGSNMKMMTTARDRASGQVGTGYGTAGDNGVFYTQNPEIAGASERRTNTLNGEKEYRVNWGTDFWKCSVFLNDVAFSSGFQPDMTDNNHYRLAGQLHWSKKWEEVGVDKAAPGCGWQRFGGTGSDESHNAVLSSFVEVTDVDSEWERWKFSIVGAEDERAAESEREHLIKKGTNENDVGKKIRFFKPKYER